MADRMRFVTLRPDRGWAEEILSQDGGPNTNHTAENRKMATDIVMNIGEALAGEGNEIAHIDLLIGKKEGPVGTGVRQCPGKPVGRAHQTYSGTCATWASPTSPSCTGELLNATTANLEKIRTLTRVAAE